MCADLPIVDPGEPSFDERRMQVAWVGCITERLFNAQGSLSKSKASHRAFFSGAEVGPNTYYVSHFDHPTSARHYQVWSSMYMPLASSSRLWAIT